MRTWITPVSLANIGQHHRSYPCLIVGQHHSHHDGGVAKKGQV